MEHGYVGTIKAQGVWPAIKIIASKNQHMDSRHLAVVVDGIGVIVPKQSIEKATGDDLYSIEGSTILPQSIGNFTL